MSIRVSVTKPSGGSPFRRFQVLKASTAWADEIGPLVRSALKAKAPIAKEGTGAGRLRQSIRYERNTRAGGVSASFYTTVPYAKYVIEGTSPHIIRARAARALHWKDAGGARFARQVNHPGTKPNPFPNEAVEPLIPVIQKRFAEILREAMGGL